MISQNPESKSWYLVYTKPRGEETALANLARQGYEVYFPRVQLMRKRQRGRMAVVEPLFPRYLFIRLDNQSDNWAPIRSTLGVTSLVRFGHEPAKVPDDLIRFLQQQEDSDGLRHWTDPAIEAGDHVRVADGAFQGYKGILLARSSRERVFVLLDILGKQVRMNLPYDQLERT